MSDIALRAGVSKNAVSLALRHDPQIPEKTRRRIERVARSMGYKKNPTVTHLMAQLRMARAPAFQASLALLNANQDVAAFTRHPTIPIYVSGCRRRAADLGYSLDEFWLHDPQLNGERLDKILRARNIKGAIVVGLMKENRLPEKFQSTWAAFPIVVTGVRTREPALSFACTDHHMLALKAFQKALELGYRRPALVLDHVIDGLTFQRGRAGGAGRAARVAPHAAFLFRRGGAGKTGLVPPVVREGKARCVAHALQRRSALAQGPARHRPDPARVARRITGMGGHGPA